jgi:multiple sugar transport system substrate-binding protein
MRPVHFLLGAIAMAVALIAVLEPTPRLEDFDRAQHAEFAATWDKRVHLSYWEKWGSFEGEAAVAMVDDFNRGQDEIFVHYVQTSQVDRKSTLAIIGNDPPDVVGLWSSNIPPFADAGALTELDERVAASGLKPDYYVENYLKLGEYRGHIYSLPTSPASVALFYNKEHFRKKAAQLLAAGLDPNRPPRTIEELDRYADVLNEFAPDGTPAVMGFLPTEPGWWNFVWGYYFGGKLFDERSGAITADEAGNVKAFEWIKRYAERYGRQKLLQFRQGFGTFDSPHNAFIDDRVSMEIQGVWFPNFIRRHRPHMEFGVAPFPTAEGVAGPMSYLEADELAIPRGCKHPAEAWKFLCYVQTRGLAILCRQQGKNMPVRNPPASFRQGHPNLELDVFEKVADSPHSFVVPRIFVQQEYQDEMNTAFEHVWSWPVPEAPLQGLAGAERQAKVDSLCREEILKTLAQVRRRIQAQYDEHIERERQRGEAVPMPGQAPGPSQAAYSSQARPSTTMPSAAPAPLSLPMPSPSPIPGGNP